MIKEAHLDESRIQNHAIVFRSDSRWYKNIKAYIEKMTPADIAFTFHSHDFIDCIVRQRKPSEYYKNTLRGKKDKT